MEKYFDLPIVPRLNFFSISTNSVEMLLLFMYKIVFKALNILQQKNALKSVVWKYMFPLLFSEVSFLINL